MMSTTTQDTPSTFIPKQGVLRALRTLASEPAESLIDLLQVADQQAELLHKMLPDPPEDILEHLTRCIPSIMIEYVDTMPVPGSSFWGNGHWHIHLRTGDRITLQAFTVLHELKHIIDHPLRRRQADLLGRDDWEGVADYFAAQVLARKPRPVTALGERRNAYE